MPAFGFLARLLAALALMALAAPAGLAAEAAMVRVKLTGIPTGPMRSNALRAIPLRGLTGPQLPSEAQIKRLHRQALREIPLALEAFGYYAADVTGTLTRNQDGGWLASYRVAPGEPVRIREVSVLLDGEAESDASIRATLAELPLSDGEVFVHADYEAYKSAVQQALAERGYLDATLIESRVAVEVAKGTARIRLSWQTGLRYRLGAVRFEGSHIDLDRLQSLVPWRPRAFFQNRRLIDLQNRLSDTQYFGSVDVMPLRDEAEGRLLPVRVQLTPNRRTAYTGGVLYGSDSGLGLRAGMERRYVNARGHRFRAEFRLGQRQSGAGGAYELPLPGLLPRSLGLSAGWRDEQTDSFRSRLGNLSVYLSAPFGDWLARASLNLTRGNFTVAGRPGESTLIYPELRLRTVLAEEVADGLTHEIVLRAAPGSSTRLISGEATSTYTRALGRDWRLLLRGSVGALRADDFDRLPPNLRFFAGGDRSLRGYGHQTLGPRDAAGAVIGGTRLGIVTLEVERRIRESWSVAAFVDHGNAFSSGARDPVSAVGTGLRWRSPVGALRVDLAYGLDDPGGFRLHLTLGDDR